MNNTTWLHLARDYTLLDAKGVYAPWLQEIVGTCLWNTFPDSRAAYLPVYEKAWQDGYVNEYVHDRGAVCSINCNVAGNKLIVCVKVWTIAGLREAVAELEQYLSVEAA